MTSHLHPCPGAACLPLFSGAQKPRPTRLHKAIRSFRARPLWDAV